MSIGKGKYRKLCHICLKKSNNQKITQPQYLNKTSSCKTTIRCTNETKKTPKNNKLKVLRP